MSQRMPDYETLRATEARVKVDPAVYDDEAALALADAIRTRRRIKCIAQGYHTEDCQHCGIK